MRSRWWVVLAALVVVLLAAYLAAGWYFANIAIAPPARSLTEAEAQAGRDVYKRQDK